MQNAAKQLQYHPQGHQIIANWTHKVMRNLTKWREHHRISSPDCSQYKSPLKWLVDCVWFSILLSPDVLYSGTLVRGLTFEHVVAWAIIYIYHSTDRTISQSWKHVKYNVYTPDKAEFNIYTVEYDEYVLYVEYNKICGIKASMYAPGIQWGYQSQYGWHGDLTWPWASCNHWPFLPPRI